MKNLLQLLTPAFIFYSIISGLMSGSSIAILTTSFAVSILVYLKNQPPPKENIDSVLGLNKIQVIAHRGGATDAPENTLESIRTAHENGADAVELDLEFTADGVPILMHDGTVDRTTNGSGPVKSFTYEQMQTLDASAKHQLKEKFPGAKVPTLEDAVTLSLELGLKIYLDVKGNADQAVPAILEMYKKYPAMYKNAIVCSFWPQISYLVRRSDPNIVAALTHRDSVLSRKVDGREFHGTLLQRLFSPFADILLKFGIYRCFWFSHGTSAVLLITDDVSQQTVDYFADRGVRVIVWTPNNAHDKAYFANTLGLSYITDTLTTSHKV